jgi:hypothetical protein
MSKAVPCWNPAPPEKSRICPKFGLDGVGLLPPQFMFGLPSAGLVEDVNPFNAELNALPLGDSEVLDGRKIHVPNPRTVQTVAPHIAELSGRNIREACDIEPLVGALFIGGKIRIESGRVKQARIRDILTAAAVCSRFASNTSRGNSGNSSRNSTPLRARLTSPGRGVPIPREEHA